MTEELNNLKITMERMKTDLEYIKKALGENGEEHKIIIVKIDKWIDGCENKFSAKWVETSIIWAGRIIIGTILLALLALIIKQN